MEVSLIRVMLGGSIKIRSHEGLAIGALPPVTND
ncbi:hypothetical protein BH10CHL1_BH10CHL1_17010 [soil metagenome]